MIQPREQDGIQCLECGKWFRALPPHLRRTHGMTDEDYRIKYLIPVGVPLVCIEWSENQSRRNIERQAARTLTNRGPGKGFRQRESVRLRRDREYKALATTGSVVAATKDKTAARIVMLQPLPCTVSQATERLGCTPSAAYTFLAYCVKTGRLRRVARGKYDLPE